MTDTDGLEARERLVREWQGPIYSYVFRMLRREAEAADVTQEVFTQALGLTAPWRRTGPRRRSTAWRGTPCSVICETVG